MKTIAIIDDDIHIGDMLAEVLAKTGIVQCGLIPAPRLCIYWRGKDRI